MAVNTHIAGLMTKFNLAALTAADVAEYNGAAVRWGVRAMAATYAKCVTECPKEWGAPDDAATYERLNFIEQFQPLAKSFLGATEREIKKVEDCELEVEFKLTGLTAAEIGDHFEILLSNDIKGQAELFAEIVERFPMLGERIDEPEAYLDLQFYPYFAALRQEFIAAASGNSKKTKSKKRR
jgi:hypothetical protein